jgi:hypothetical protein
VLNGVHREYADRGFAVLGVAMDERGWAAVTPFLAERRVDYPVLLGTAAVGGLTAVWRFFHIRCFWTARVVSSPVTAPC